MGCLKLIWNLCIGIAGICFAIWIISMVFSSQSNSGKTSDAGANVAAPAGVQGDVSQANPPPPAKFSLGDYTNKDYICTKTDGIKCVSKSQWKEMCEQASGITEYAGKIVFASWAGDEAASYLYDNGGYSGESFKWANGKDARGEDGRCVATLAISGTYQGSQVERSKDGAVEEFTVKDDGKVLAHRINTYGY
jgi:hypothetical protein